MSPYPRQPVIIAAAVLALAGASFALLSTLPTVGTPSGWGTGDGGGPEPGFEYQGPSPGSIPVLALSPAFSVIAFCAICLPFARITRMELLTAAALGFFVTLPFSGYLGPMSSVLTGMAGGSASVLLLRRRLAPARQ